MHTAAAIASYVPPQALGPEQMNGDPLRIPAATFNTFIDAVRQ